MKYFAKLYVIERAPGRRRERPILLVAGVILAVAVAFGVAVSGCTASASDGEAPTKLYANCEYYAPTSTTGVMVGVTVCEMGNGVVCYSRGDGMSCLGRGEG